MAKKILISIGLLALGSLITLGILFGYDILPRDGYKLNIETLGVWVGSIGTICAFIGVIVTTKGQIENNNKRVKEQIENQNKESHRPYLCLYRCRVEDESRLSEIINFKITVNGYGDTFDFKNQFIKVINAGYGTAVNIRFYGITYIKNNREIDSSYLDHTTREHLIECIMEKDEIYIRLGMKIYQQNNNMILPIYFLVLYSDLNYNVYSTLIIFERINNDGFTANFYNDNSKKFSMKISELNVDFFSIKQKYIDNILNNVEEY